MAMNILRLMSQRGLLGPDAPVHQKAKRRRIKTVIQELIYRAGLAQLLKLKVLNKGVVAKATIAAQQCDALGIQAFWCVAQKWQT